MRKVRFSIVVSKETDKALRSYLAQKGRMKGDISMFVDEAVWARLFELTVADLKGRNRVYSQRAIRKTIHGALVAVA